jgi:hypothetical protein
MTIFLIVFAKNDCTDESEIYTDLLNKKLRTTEVLYYISLIISVWYLPLIAHEVVSEPPFASEELLLLVNS